MLKQSIFTLPIDQNYNSNSNSHTSLSIDIGIDNYFTTAKQDISYLTFDNSSNNDTTDAEKFSNSIIDSWKNNISQLKYKVSVNLIQKLEEQSKDFNVYDYLSDERMCIIHNKKKDKSNTSQPLRIQRENVFPCFKGIKLDFTNTNDVLG